MIFGNSFTPKAQLATIHTFFLHVILPTGYLDMLSIMPRQRQQCKHSCLVTNESRVSDMSDAVDRYTANMTAQK